MGNMTVEKILELVSFTLVQLLWYTPDQWSPTPGSWTGTGPTVNWHRAAQKQCITYIILSYLLLDSERCFILVRFSAQV